MDKVIIIA